MHLTCVEKNLEGYNCPFGSDSLLQGEIATNFCTILYGD